MKLRYEPLMINRILIGTVLYATAAAAQDRTMPPESERQLARAIYKEMVEVKSGFTTGTTTPIAEAAARRYFHKSAAELSPVEAALLAAAIANPHIFDPGHPSARLHRRQEMIMGRMGAVTPPPVVAPTEAPMNLVPALPDAAPITMPGAILPPEKPPKKSGGG